MTATTRRTPTPWAATAAAVRAAVKAARAAGTLALPDGVTVKVTSDSFAGGASVDVTLSGADDWAWTAAPADDPYHRDRILTDAVKAAGTALEDVIRRHRTAGYIWGGVTYNGTVIGSLARQGFVPGQD